MKIITYLVFLLSMFMAHAQSDQEVLHLGIIPRDWIRLTETDSGLIVYNTCKKGNKSITIHHNDHRALAVEIKELHKQNVFDIVRGNAQSNNDSLAINLWNGETMPNGTIITGVLWFKWYDEQNGIGTWYTYFTDSQVKYVAMEKVMEYPIIDQPCNECWEVEQCTLYTASGTIRSVLENYIQNGESTDIQKHNITVNLKEQTTTNNPNDISLIIDVWLHYDSTNSYVKDLALKALKLNRKLSQIVINHRISSLKKWRRRDSKLKYELNLLLEKLDE
jgi:hypothetical protein